MGTSSGTRHFPAWSLLAAVLIVLLPAFAAAQEPVKSFDQLNTRLKVGDTVWVTDPQGREIKGKIRDIAPAALTLDHDGPATLAADAVRLVAVHKGKPVVRTMLIGLGIGAAAGAVLGASCGDCDTAMATSMGLLWGSLIGAGAGAAIGATRTGKEVVVYRAPGMQAARLSFTPVITPRAKGVVVAVSF